MSFVSSWLIPIIKVAVFTGFFGFIGFVAIRAFHKCWTKKYKYVFRHKILKKPYPIETVTWCMDCLDQDLSYYDVKKFLIVKSFPKLVMNETLWIYEQLFKELKGGLDKDDRKFKGFGNEIETKQSIPKYSTKDLPRD